MTLAAHRRPVLTALALVLLLAGLPGRCFALDEIMDVSPARARELGIMVRLQPRAEDVWVQVEFKPTEPKKAFKYTVLDVTQGGKRLVSTYLMPFKPTPESLRFDAYLAPAAVPDSTVTVTVWEDPLTGIGYQLKLKEFMPPPQAAGPAPVAAARSAGAAETTVLVADEKPVLFKLKDVTLEQVDQPGRTIGVSIGRGPRPLKLADLPLGEEIRIRVSLVYPGVANNVPFDWERLKGLVGKRVSMLVRAEGSHLSVDAIAVAND